MSSSVELDPLFLRGLRLLHSAARESAEQLRQLLDEVLAQKHSSGSSIASLSLTLSRQDKGIIAIKQESDVKHTISKKVSPKHTSADFQSIKLSSDESKRKDAEKRQFERLKQELSDLQNFEQVKRARLDSPHSSSLSSSPSPQPLVTVIKTEAYSEPSTGSASTYQETAESDTSDDTTDAEGFALQMGLTCIVCKQLDVSSRNQLIECQECHNLYHQECHRPAVTEQEINDPRHVWYCAKCTKTMKKVTSKVQHKQTTKASVPPLPAMPVREVFPPAKVIKTEAPAPSLLPFKRTEVKASVAPGSSVCSTSIANKPIGLAGLAANLGARFTLAPSSLALTGSAHSSSNKPGFGPTKTTTSTTMLSSKSMLPFPSLSSLSSKPTPHTSTGLSPGKTGNSLGGLASLANAAVVASKSTSSSSSSKSSSVSSSSGRSSSSVGGTSLGGNGSNGSSGSSVGSKTAVSSSLMSADKRLQIMKKKAAAKMQEKRRLSSK